MHGSGSWMAKLVLVTALAALPLQGIAQAALPVDHAPGSAGHENHEVSYTGSYDSTLTHKYNSNKNKFVGSLSSNFGDPAGVLEDAADVSAVCVTDRKVSVFKFRKLLADKLMGSDKVNSLGRWSVAADVSKGKYYAKVGKSEMLIREYYNGIDFFATCKAASSPRAGL